MGRTPSGQWGGGSTMLMLIALLAFVWGLERWRKDAAHRAGSTESARLNALARCVLGNDGPGLIRSPAASRQRLRALAMHTGTQPDVTWLDRCVPLADSLARHAVEVDNTGAVTAAQTRFAQSARALALAVGRVGIVWTVRAGDTETDMDAISERLLEAATELDLAGAPSNTVPASNEPVAPAVTAMIEGARVDPVGLEPLPDGSPSRFFVGAPMPVVGEVFRDAEGWHRKLVSGEASVEFREGASGILRADAFSDPLTTGLSRLRLLRPGSDPYVAHVTLIDNPEDARRVSMDAAVAGPMLWFVEWTPWRGGVLAPFVGEMARSSVPLPAVQSQPAETTPRGSDGGILAALGVPPPPAPAPAAPPARPPVPPDEHVALAPLGADVVVAYTLHDRAGAPHVALALARWEHNRVSIVSLGDVAAPGRTPSLEFCKLEPDAGALFVAAAHGWQVLRVSAAGIARIASADATADESFDERATVRCSRDGAVAYARERTRESPVFSCRAGASGEAMCESLRTPAVPAPSTLPTYATRGPSGRPLAHPEWPISFARSGDALLAVSAVGAVVSVSRREAGTWDDGSVVFDAAAATHGMSVAGLEIYAEGDRAVLAAGTPDGLHVFESDDGGRSWH